MHAHAAEVYVLVDYEDVAALKVVLHNGVSVVVKGWPKERAKDGMQQLQAEMEVARQFELHPLMATILAAAPDAAGNWCTVSLYAGACLHDVICHPDWMSKLTAAEREALAQEVAAHDMLVKAHMHKQVSRHHQ